MCSAEASLTCCAGGPRGSDYENKKATLNKLVPMLRERALSVRYARCCALLCSFVLTHFWFVHAHSCFVPLYGWVSLCMFIFKHCWGTAGTRLPTNWKPAFCTMCNHNLCNVSCRLCPLSFRHYKEAFEGSQPQSGEKYLLCFDID